VLRDHGQEDCAHPMCARLEFVRLRYLRRPKGATLFDFFDDCAEAGSFGWEEQKEAQAKGTA
jgi:hypothetical protein